MSENGRQQVRVNVYPGVCGFHCVVQAEKDGSRKVNLKISSDCKQIRRLAELVTELSLRDIFAPITGNPAYVSAVRSGCHASCPIPSAVIKAAEVALGMALPRGVHVEFEERSKGPQKGEKS